VACVPWFSPAAHARTGEVQGAIWWENTNYYCLDADKNRAVVEQRPLIDQTQPIGPTSMNAKAPIVLNGMELVCAYATMGPSIRAVRVVTGPFARFLIGSIQVPIWRSDTNGAER
jgi:hypothetical protein